MRTFRDLPRQQPSRFVNGFVEHLQGVLRDPNEPKNMQNGQYLGTEKEGKRRTDNIKVLRRG